MKTSPPLETAVQACARLGFKKGDTLVSKFWDVPLRVSDLPLNVAEGKEIQVTRLREVAPGDWRETLRHPMKYLPADVRKKEGT